MKKYLLFLVLGSCLLLCCSKGKSDYQQKSNISLRNDGIKSYSQINSQLLDTIKYDYCFLYENENISQVLKIKVLNRSKKYDGIPEKFTFRFILINKINKKDTEITGVANLTSPNESFLDENESDSGAYFAADYNNNSTMYTINISLDIEAYEACAVSIKNDDNSAFKDFITLMKKYPEYQVMKKGNCR